MAARLLGRKRDGRHGAGEARRSATPLSIGLLLIFVIVVDVFAFLLVPAVRQASPGRLTCEFPVCYINGNLEFPAPHTVWSLDGAPASPDLITFQVSLSSTLVTMFIITIIVIVLLWPLSRKHELVPGRGQNAIEYVYEMLENFGTSLGGPGVQAVHPAVRRVLPVHPVLQLERPDPAHRQGRLSSGRPPATSTSRSASRWSRSCSSSTRASGTWASGTSASSSRSGSSRRASAPGHRAVRRPDRAPARVRQARSRCRCDSSATSTAARSPSACSRR